MMQFICMVFVWILMIVLIVVVIVVNLVYIIYMLNELVVVEGCIFMINKVIDLINVLYVVVLCMEFGQCGFLLFDDLVYLEDYEKIFNEVNQFIDQVEENVIKLDYDEQSECIEQFIYLVK